MNLCLAVFILMTIGPLSLASNSVTVIPSPQQIELKDGTAVLSNDWGILLDQADEKNLFTARYLEDKINGQFGIFLSLEDTSLPYKKNHIVLGKLTDSRLKKFIGIDENSVGYEKIGEEGYVLTVSPNGISILGNTPKGIFYGVQTLRQLVKKEGNNILIPSLKIVDYPKIKIRAVHFSGVKPDKIKEQIDKIAQLKYNTAIIESQAYFNLNRGENRELMEGIFDFARELYIEPIPEILSFGSAQGILVKDPYTVEGILVENESFIFVGNVAKSIKPTQHSLVNVVRDREDEIVVKSNDQKKTYVEGRDYKVINGRISFPFRPNAVPTQLMRTSESEIKDGEEVLVSYTYFENKPSFKFPDSTITYCPSTKRTYKVMSRVIENVLEMLKPAYISIGHDEIRGINRDNRCRKRNLSNAELLADDINKLYDFSKSIDPGVNILMWDDMLNPYYNGGNANFETQYEGLPGETYPAIELIPNDIILMTAAYDPNKNFCLKSCNFFASKGFKYLVAGWKNKQNIFEWSEIAKQRGSCLGIIDTTWYDWEGNMDAIKYAVEVSWH